MWLEHDCLYAQIHYLRVATYTHH